MVTGRSGSEGMDSKKKWEAARGWCDRDDRRSNNNIAMGGLGTQQAKAVVGVLASCYAVSLSVKPNVFVVEQILGLYAYNKN